MTVSFRVSGIRYASALRSTISTNWCRFWKIECTGGLAEDAVTHDQLALIADAAAGDARVAISILRSAARRAEQQDAETIDFGTIHEAIPEGRSEITQKNIGQLISHQRTLYGIIEEYEALAPGDLYEHYRERVDEPRSNCTVRNYLS